MLYSILGAWGETKGEDVVPAYKFIDQYGGEDMDRGYPSPT